MSLFTLLAMQGCNCELRTDMTEHGKQCPVYLRDRITRLEDALREIAEHPHCRYDLEYHCDDERKDSQYNIGCVDGHRCAAEIARKALEQP